ncbi:hypothetical protein Q4575_01480 [Psychrosphaera sp. 1_MG-2023]|uniref:hypothetical protein n=1 Tax=Psychrosphaera sp. 1_MG-2023 TaxID=3062643 RepID=UPI0026E2E0D6|nr:hypothetical protein [Psychrosphaera sp. 1_MG-2023]MDO6718050.1 hypothetical protein [Psychrosphaera sp. 1_MG-2023]
MQNVQEHLHNGQQALSEFLKTLRICQLAVKKQDTAEINASITLLIDNAFVLNKLNPFWFTLLYGSKLIAVTPFVGALLNCIVIGLRLGNACSLTKETQKELLITCCTVIYSGKPIFEKLSIDPKLTASTKTSLSTLLARSYKYACSEAFAETNTHTILGAILGGSTCKNRRLTVQALVTIVINYCLSACRHQKTRKYSSDQLLSQIAYGNYVLPVDSRLSSFYQQIVMQKLHTDESVVFVEQNNKQLIAILNGSVIEACISIAENQKKPSNYVIQEVKFDEEAQYDKNIPIFKLEQINNLSLRLLRLGLSNNTPIEVPILPVENIRFNAPISYPALYQLINIAPVNKIEQFLNEQADINSVIGYAQSQSKEVRANFTLKHAIGLIGIERLPAILMRQQFLRIAYSQNDKFSHLIINKLDQFIAITSLLSRKLDLQQQNVSEKSVLVLIMAGLISNPQILNKDPLKTLKTKSKIDFSLLDYFELSDNKVLKTHISQICVNWHVDKHVRNQLDLYLKYIEKSAPLRLIPKKYQFVILCIELAGYMYLAINSVSYRGLLRDEQVQNIMTELKLDKAGIRELLNQVVENAAPITSLE